MILGYVIGFTNAVMALLVTFNLVLTQTQSAAVDGLINTGGILLIGIWHAYSTSKHPAIQPPAIAASRSTVE